MTWTILDGDVRARLAEMPDESAHCVVTSPPYWNLRDYKTATWHGGREDCDHVEREIRTGLGLAAWSAEFAAGGGHKAADVDKIRYRDVCEKCGARRIDQQVGLEATPEEYVRELVGVFREVRRVLRRDGTVWLNVGDSYNNRTVTRPSSHQGGLGFSNESIKTSWTDARNGRAHLSIADGDLKEKDLIGVPWMLAFALRADGWYLRSEVVWAKPNPMPESVDDRPTQAHEKLFLLARSERYFYDAFAVREQSPASEQRRGTGPNAYRTPTDADRLRLELGYAARRNKRNVWEVATVAFPEAHFATFPPKLVEPCVLAGSSPRVCGVCGAPWRRLVEKVLLNPRSAARKHLEHGSAGYEQRLEAQQREVGWRAGCRHLDATGRAVVLDPFAGAGTVGVVCEWLGRDFLGIELNAAYAAMARRRITAEGPLGRPARRPRLLPADHATLFEL